MPASHAVLSDDRGHLLLPLQRSSFCAEPLFPRDTRLSLITRDEAYARYQSTTWAGLLDVPPTLVLCRYSDASSRRQPAWLAMVESPHTVPLPWYFGLEGQVAPPAPPWEVTVVINASNGIRIVDHVLPQNRGRLGRSCLPSGEHR